VSVGVLLGGGGCKCVRMCVPNYHVVYATGVGAV